MKRRIAIQNPILRYTAKIIAALFLITGLLCGAPHALAAEDDVVLTVSYTENGSQIEIDFTQAQIDAMPQGAYTYSNYNTYPTYGTNSVSGVRVDVLLAAAGVDLNSLGGGRAIRFVSGDGSGYSSILTWEQITEDRYYYTQSGEQVAQVPAIIGFSSDDPGEANLPRNFIGQAAAGEQTRNAFVRSLARIEVQGTAGTWASPAANPVSGTQVTAGDLIRLSTPPGYPADAKIYYTLDGNEPTRSSAMYNLVADQWLSQRGMQENAPITVPAGSGTLVVRAKIIGLGMLDGQEAVFQYPYRSVPGLLDQAPPQGLSGGILAIIGTTANMEYNTIALAASGWIRCSNGSTQLAAGVYYVRFAATATHNPSPFVQIVVNDRTDLLSQAPPTGVTGGNKIINGTTSAMEYNAISTAASGWIRCSNGSTVVEPGTYFVRFAATETHNASTSVLIVVNEETDISNAVISVFNGGRLAKAFSQNDINAMPKYGPATYSGHNTWPAYETLSGVTGVRVMDLLAASGVSGLSSGQGIRFTSGDGYSAVITVRQLEEPRYFYSNSGTRGAQVQSVINVAQGGDYRRLAFGQAAAGEQVRQALVKNVVRIDVEGGAGSWGSPSASPAQGSTVSQGAPIKLILPSGQGDAKIYYTLDGSEPTRSSNIYNLVADRWLFQKGMDENTPISAPGGAFTIKAKIIGIGKGDGPIVSFAYNSQKQEKPPAAQIINPSLDDLINGDVVLDSDNSVFVPGAPGSVTWNEDEMDGYYDEELGGYVLTPKAGVKGTVRFTYTDENGEEHQLSVEVVSADANDLLKIDDQDSPLAAGGVSGGGNGSLFGMDLAGGAEGGLPQWLFIAIIAACGAAIAVFVMKLPDLVRRLRKNAA